MDTSLMLVIMLGGFIAIMYYNQQKYKNKMLCFFRRPNNLLIKKWVPVDNRWVVFDNQRYIIDPACIALHWFDEGMAKFNPILVPTMEFRWDTPYPLDPRTFTVTWQTPESVNASFQSSQQVAFSKGAAAQSGKKSRFPEWFFPVITVGAVLVVGYLVYSMQGQIAYLEALIKAGN